MVIHMDLSEMFIAITAVSPMTLLAGGIIKDTSINTEHPVISAWPCPILRTSLWNSINSSTVPEKLKWRLNYHNKLICNWSNLITYLSVEKDRRDESMKQIEATPQNRMHDTDKTLSISYPYLKHCRNIYRILQRDFFGILSQYQSHWIET